MSERFSLAPLGDYDFYLGSELYQLGCFDWYSDDLLDNLAAALAAHLTGAKSIDRIKKSFVLQPRIRNDWDSPAKLAYQLLEQHIVECYNHLKPRHDAKLGEFVFDQAVVRSLTTIRTSLYLARRGYVFETAMVARGALEQIAWAWGASKVDNEDELFKISPQKQITHLTRLIHYAGRLYGVLSDYSHFHTNVHSLFYAEKNGEVAVRATDRGTKYLSMHWPFYICDVLLCVFEDVYRANLPKLIGITKTGKLRKRRFTSDLHDAYFKDVDEDAFLNLFS